MVDAGLKGTCRNGNLSAWDHGIRLKLVLRARGMGGLAFNSQLPMLGGCSVFIGF